ncbi:sigma-70 family RNA polymerase sigma factor [Clostridium sp. Marseille-Q2269]|uniref:sigma-70 family RNA polymerase sigma factor n=1 Tax=Clostridium sp. Marseille-Q2269 TaxID=2942205 RepID=UPI0020748EFE|nr:sigma-70 family RNA polymerase sigma factor [Clostridium sp. Marseille-Q2269]
MHELIKKIRQGDINSLEKIVDDFTPIILKEASKYNIKSYYYEDLVQHGYLSVIKAVNIYKGEDEDFKSYCVESIRESYKELLKDEIKHHREIQDESIFGKNEQEYLFTVEDEVLAYEKTQQVSKVLQTLTPVEQGLIQGTPVEDKKKKKVSKKHNKSYNNIGYQKERIVKRLQNILKK